MEVDPLDEREELNLEPYLVTQAEHQLSAAESTLDARLPETYQWLIVPTQGQDPRAAIKWEAIRLTGQDGLAERASKRLRNDELLLPSWLPHSFALRWTVSPSGAGTTWPSSSLPKISRSTSICRGW